MNGISTIPGCTNGFVLNMSFYDIGGFINLNLTRITLTCAREHRNILVGQYESSKWCNPIHIISNCSSYSRIDILPWSHDGATRCTTGIVGYRNSYPGGGLACNKAKPVIRTNYAVSIADSKKTERESNGNTAGLRVISQGYR